MATPSTGHNWHQFAIEFWLAHEEVLTTYLAANHDKVRAFVDKTFEAAAASVWTELKPTVDQLVRQFLIQRIVFVSDIQYTEYLQPALKRVLALYLMYWRRQDYKTVALAEIAKGLSGLGSA